MSEETKSKLDWIETKLKSRELQRDTSKRTIDDIALLITEVRLLVDIAKAPTPTELERLQAENARLREALQPFAQTLTDYEAWEREHPQYTFEEFAERNWDWESVKAVYEQARKALGGE